MASRVQRKNKRRKKLEDYCERRANRSKYSRKKWEQERSAPKQAEKEGRE